MKIRKFAAIDIGSNAIRLLTHNVIEEKNKPVRFRKSSLVRVPVRLGEDSFTIGEISERNTKRIIDTMKAFKLLIEVHGVEKFRACATSALREANNGLEIIARIKNEAAIEVEIIDGRMEAEIIASFDLRELLQKEHSYLYIDVGGGSTEFTIFSRGRLIASKSAKIGTVRLLNEGVEQRNWINLEHWIKEYTQNLPEISIIGSGGNINKLHKMSGRKLGEPLTHAWLKGQLQFLEGLTYNQRVSELGLNPDRADVIIPATKIYVLAAKWSGAKKIHVPKIGLSDGIIKALYFTGK
ncbi:exopolyphosphatase [Arenibacter sp. GZD96]|uniref:Ppx/GppA phosphatase family protein n=1 Tax=Aurantibrevibacter litoralis TaxID=3106030 RepID=UPI002B000516|nr:hypothetical protein [Arenibacter sp. GZD-96]MEA1784925.1 exopolyphosphatase [Arenibacter sp. GZD-96]